MRLSPGFWTVFGWMKRNIIWLTAVYGLLCLALILMQGDGTQ